jgi:hypothetical protein
MTYKEQNICSCVSKLRAQVEWCFCSNSVPMLDVSLPLTKEEALKYKTEANIVCIIYNHNFCCVSTLYEQKL